MTPTTPHAQDVRRADELEREGRLLDAVEVLTASNRIERSAEVEQRLVDLRHRGFSELQEPGRPSWPLDVPDRFAGSASPPEIDARDLSADAIASGVVNHGSLIVRELLSGELLVRLQENVVRAFAARDAMRERRSPGADAPWYVRYAPGGDADNFGNAAFVRAVDSPPTLFGLIETYREIGLLDLVTEHLGERPAVSANKCALRRIVVTEMSIPDGMFHQDGAFLGKGIRALNVWLALSDCGGDSDSPALDIVPRRLPGVLPTGTDGALFDWTVARPVVDEVAGDHPVTRPRFSAGDALLFDELLLHSTGISLDMTKPRYAIECWFFAPSVYPEGHVAIVF